MRIERRGRGFEPNLDPDSPSGESKSDRNHEKGPRCIVASELSIIFSQRETSNSEKTRKIRANIFKNKIKNLNVWLVGARKMCNWFREELANQMWRNCEDEK